MSGQSEENSQLEELERDQARLARDVLERLDAAVRLCEELQAGQRDLVARVADLEQADLEERLGDRIDRLIGRLERNLGGLEQVEAKLEALDASFVRHQGQNEDDFRRAEQSVDRVGQDLSRHEDAHFRGGR